METALPPSIAKLAVTPDIPALKTYIVIPDPRMDSQGSLVMMNQGCVPVKGIWTIQLSPVPHTPTGRRGINIIGPAGRGTAYERY